MARKKTLGIEVLVFSVFGFILTNPSWARPLKIIAVSDINGSLGSLDYPSTVVRGVQSFILEKPDVVIGVGDYVAGEDVSHKYPLSRFSEMWNAFKVYFLDPILQSQTEFAPSPGNHDASGYPKLQRERDVYVDFWSRNVPRIEFIDSRNYPYYYSFKVDNVFFISMDDVTPFQIHHGDEQRQWIREQLSSSIAQTARARIVYGHIPLYPLLEKSKYASKGRGKYYEVLNREQWEVNPDGLEKIFINQKVSLVVFGHSHAFFPGRVVHDRPDGQYQLKILSMPCLGSGSRYLSGQNARSQTGFALIDIDDDGNIEVNGYNHNGNLVNKSGLPQRIIVPGKYNRYYRDDI
ncbi:MAG: metallophosphoesterase [Bdellovibrionales bacterium]|nr:metallophosphoesterase [Bdellovibrionales bacterium]